MPLTLQDGSIELTIANIETIDDNYISINHQLPTCVSTKLSHHNFLKKHYFYLFICKEKSENMFFIHYNIHFKKL